MHRGTDFAAPSGTNNGLATQSQEQDGVEVVETVKINIIQLMKQSMLTWRILQRNKEGRKVARSIIDIGSTGMSTGLHLHYEVLINGKSQFQTLKLPSGKILKGEARNIFELERIKTDLKMSELR